jgi:hypothetical protein
MSTDTDTGTRAESDQPYTEEHIPVSAMIHDIAVNPRNPSDSWIRKKLPEYNTSLIGMFVLSERLPGDGSRQLAILDGSNRALLMRLAGDEDREVMCQVFHGLTKPQEAQIARRYNERRQWLSIRVFQSRVTEGDQTANAVKEIILKNGWRLDTASGDGIIRGVRDFYRLIETSQSLAVKDAGNPGKGTERWKAAQVNGEQAALRVLEEAFQVYSAAFRTLPGAYAPLAIYGISMVLLREGSRVDLERLTTKIRDESNGQRALIADARALGSTLRMNTADGVALLVIKYYNTGFSGNSRARLEERWNKTAK